MRALRLVAKRPRLPVLECARLLSTAVAPRHWDWNSSRSDLKKPADRPLPPGVTTDDLDPDALERDVVAYGAAREVWNEIRETAMEQHRGQSWRTDDLVEFGVDSYLRRHILDHASLACGLSICVGGKLGASGSANTLSGGYGGSVDFRAILLSAFKADPDIVDAVAHDIKRFKTVDPATDSLLGVYLFYKGVQALCCARVANHFYTRRGDAGKLIAFLLQSEMSAVFGVDIHPGCVLGRGITIDHATGVVLGETAVIGDNVYLMHDVTLGATGTSESRDRHPKIQPNVFLGAKCTILGNITIGEGATVAAAALVNKDVPAGHTAVGMPARNIPPKPNIEPGTQLGTDLRHVTKIDVTKAK